MISYPSDARLYPSEDAATGGEISGDSALPTGEDNSTGGDSSDGTGNNVDWKSEWGSRLAELKVQISSLPSYSGVQNGTHTVLLESQVEILRKYDRDSSSRELDDVCFSMRLAGIRKVLKGFQKDTRPT